MVFREAYVEKRGLISFHVISVWPSYECNNPLFGRTNNPYDVTRTPGGSTGGEGAIIGAGASIIGELAFCSITRLGQ